MWVEGSWGESSKLYFFSTKYICEIKNVQEGKYVAKYCT